MLNSKKEEVELFSNDFTKKENSLSHDISFFKLSNNAINLDTEGMNEDNQNDKFDKNYPGISPNNFSFFSFPLNPFEFSNSITGKTESNSLGHFSNRKRNREEIKNKDEQNSLIKEENSEEKSNSEINKKIGRRLKDKIYETEANHNKNSADNIITKIKTAIFKYILDHLNQSLEFTKYKFYPLNVKLSTCLNKKFNMELLNRTVYDLYNTEDLNKNYINGNDSNKILIKKIFDEKKEKKTIDILNMKFKDILDHIRQKDSENFLNQIKNKEKKNKGKDIDLLMDNVKHFLFFYENWFKIKNERNTKIK